MPTATPTDASTPLLPNTCAECAFWHRPPTGVPSPERTTTAERALYTRAGFCRKRNPGPSSLRSELTQWPLTLNTDHCLTGRRTADVTAGNAPPVVRSCSDCVAWRRPPTGIPAPERTSPAERRLYGALAGYCRMESPGPGSRPPELTHWPATLATDACGAGQPKDTKPAG